MKNGDIVYWFRATIGGEIRFYKVKITDWDYAEDVAGAEILKRRYDNISNIKSGPYSIDKSELWTIKRMIELKQQVFKFIFKVRPK
jgi:hypothetical protein